MAITNGDLLEQLDRHLACPCQNWLLGAGISKDANIPLMVPLTARVMTKADVTEHKPLLDALLSELPEGSHIEHLLSHLGDYATLAERSKTRSVAVNGRIFAVEELTSAHSEVLRVVAETVRWGYKPAYADQPESVGTAETPLVSVDGHNMFIEALFGTAQAGVQERRGPTRIFTTNYDTLLEDALALSCIPYWDGFSGGAVAYRSYRFGQDEPESGFRAHVVKLHGSIDWHLGEDGKVWRVRDGDLYPTRTARVLIYPQATKYLATQRDPFAAQFDLFRRALSTTADNVMVVCGYSFGDDHINQEIEHAMERPGNRTTLLAFCFEGKAIPECLGKWRLSLWGKRVYIATEKGLYVGKDGPFHPAEEGQSRNWWTFTGVTRLLKDGAESSL